MTNRTVEGPIVTDGGPWRGPTLEAWLARIARPSLREGETLPFIKPPVIGKE